MTDKELHKLSRRDLLQLMLEAVKESEESKRQRDETQLELDALQENYERLRKRLDVKDAQIQELRTTLQMEREKREIELAKAGSIAKAALKLNGVFEAAQQAAEQYVYNVKRLAEMRFGMGSDSVPTVNGGERAALETVAGAESSSEESAGSMQAAEETESRVQTAEEDRQRENDEQSQWTESGEEGVGAPVFESDRDGASERTA